MKTFDDLNFDSEGRSQLFFPNGYGASVITGEMAFSSSDEPYELAILRGTPDDHQIDYSTPIADDVIGYLTADEVTQYLKQIQELPKP